MNHTRCLHSRRCVSTPFFRSLAVALACAMLAPSYALGGRFSQIPAIFGRYLPRRERDKWSARERTDGDKGSKERQNLDRQQVLALIDREPTSQKTGRTTEMGTLKDRELRPIIDESVKPASTTITTQPSKSISDKLTPATVATTEGKTSATAAVTAIDSKAGYQTIKDMLKRRDGFQVYDDSSELDTAVAGIVAGLKNRRDRYARKTLNELNGEILRRSRHGDISSIPRHAALTLATALGLERLVERTARRGMDNHIAKAKKFLDSRRESVDSMDTEVRLAIDLVEPFPNLKPVLSRQLTGVLSKMNGVADYAFWSWVRRLKLRAQNRHLQSRPPEEVYAEILRNERTMDDKVQKKNRAWGTNKLSVHFREKFKKQKEPTEPRERLAQNIDMAYQKIREEKKEDAAQHYYEAEEILLEHPEIPDQKYQDQLRELASHLREWMPAIAKRHKEQGHFAHTHTPDKEMPRGIYYGDGGGGF